MPRLFPAAVRRRRAWIIAAGVTAMVATIAVGWARTPRPFAPRQPIYFSHTVHATDDEIDCLYCHAGARRSPFAGVPSVERCMGCHRHVLTENPEVITLTRYWEMREPIPWVKVYALPRFVRFNHEAHARANVSCQTCHGPVQSMARVAKVNDLQMGWCVECHRARDASVDCLTCHY